MIRALAALAGEQDRQTKARVRQSALVDPEASWGRASLAQRRLMIDLVIQAVLIGPAGRGRREAALDSITIAWRQ